jgi:hypothetical protein
MESQGMAIRVAGGGVAVAAAALCRSKLLAWGATPGEVADGLPGDEIVVDADMVATRGITIGCPPSEVWPWIAQLGQGRGGWYSYDFLENLVGCDIHSADRIVPVWQQVHVGDEIHLAPNAGLRVAIVDPGRALVLYGSVPVGGNPSPFDSTWAFVLREAADGTTRLVVRERYHYRSWWAGLIVEPTEVVSFVMSQKMLRGLRGRAEYAAARPNSW